MKKINKGNIKSCGNEKNINHKGFVVLGWNSQPEWYSDIVSRIKNGIIVEVGVYGGASLLSIIDLCIKNNNTLYGVDPWEKIEVANGAVLSDDSLQNYRSVLQSVRENLYMIKKQLRYKNMKLIHDFSSNAVNQFSDKSVDVVYIDGDHSYKYAYEDMVLWAGKIKHKGILCGDDFVIYDIHKAVADFCANAGLQYFSCKRKWWCVIE